MQIAAFFVILMQLIAEPCYNVYFHNGNIYPVPTGICNGENTTFQLLVLAKDTIIWIRWQHLSFQQLLGIGCRAGRCLLKVVVQLWLLPTSRVGEQFPPRFLHQNLQCPLLAGLHTGPWEQIGTKALPVTCSWLLSEADLAWGCRTKLMLLVQASPWHQAALPTRVLHRAASMVQGWTLHLPAFCWKGHLIQEKLGLVLLPSCGCPKEATAVTVSHLHKGYLPIQADTAFQ